MATFSLQSLSVFPMPVATAMKIAKQAGFDGIEVFRFYGPLGWPSLEYFRNKAFEHGLALSFHEAFSWKNDVTQPAVRIPVLWGALVPENASLNDMFGDAEERVVAYPHHLPEIIDRRLKRRPMKNWCIQTASTVPAGIYRVQMDDLLPLLISTEVGVVFDTQHFLEMSWNRIGPGVDLLTRDRDHLMKMLVDGFNRLLPNIRAIHLNNFNPDGGSKKGRNLPLKEGTLPLHEFCQHVRSSGWNGPVHPELHPRFFSRFSVRKNIETASRLREEVGQIWGE